MPKSRMEAFSDGVLAVIITIMVLEMKAPRGSSLHALGPVAPVFLSYILSFIYIGIYWSNHHHLLQATEHVNGSVLWANLHLLFWASLVPFTTAWLGENILSTWPVVVYGIVMFMTGVAYFILAKMLIRLHGKDSTLARALGSDQKTIISVAIYAASIAVAFALPWAACIGYVAVAILWLCPDPRIASAMARQPGSSTLNSGRREE